MSIQTGVTLWHNPHCSKSRGTLALLRGRGIEPAIVDYQKCAPSVSDIEHALQMLGMQPRDIIRKSESVYVDLGLENPGLTRGQLIDAMAAHPILIERPIVFADGQAAIGRPPENVLAILQGHVSA